jgi:SNF2 family DNA or RNA helicase
MLFYNNISITYDICDDIYNEIYNDISKQNIQQYIGYIKNNINIDNFDMYPNIQEIMTNKSDIYKIYMLNYFELHKIDNIDIKFKIDIQIIKIIQPELFTPQLILDSFKLRDVLHNHFITINNIIDINAHNYKMDMFMKKIQNKTQVDYPKIIPLISSLFPYQINCINWMKLMELDILDNTIDISNDRIIKLNNGIYYNFIKNTFLTHEDVLKMKHIVRGGIIANEVGTGKTAIAIGHIMNDTNTNNYNLILVPSHLKLHWINEFEKHTKLNIYHFNISLVTFDEFKFFSIDELKNMTQYTRIIIDELHEIYDKKILDNISYIPNIKYRWGITGTPIIDKHSLYNILTYLIGKSSREFYNKLISHENIFQDTFTKFFQRTMKIDINDYINLPNITINNILLKFSEFEQQIYDLESMNNTNINFLHKLCCDILLSIDNSNSQQVSIKELKQQVLDFLTKQYNKESRELLLLSDKINNIKLNIKQNIYLDLQNTHLEFNLDHYMELYKEQEKICEQRKVIMERYSEILNKIECIMNVDKEDIQDIHEDMNEDMNEDMCSICLGSYTQPIAYLITCGHYYCKSCFDMYKMSNHNGQRCPMCRVDISMKDILCISNDITKYTSTKYKEVIKLITNTKENFVIYTQYSHILQNLKIHIERFNITCGYLDDFNSGDIPQVLLISTYTTSSGIDLTHYSNIIIFEPFVNYIYSREKEKQIIGRIHRINQTKPVNIFRLIIHATVEEEIYNINIL